MKNIHVLPTDKPSRLHFTEFFEELVFTPKYEKLDGVNIYITSDEEIKEGDWIFDLDVKKVVKADNLKVTTSKKSQCWYYKKIILTTDQDLIKDGVQAIDDEFLEWFVNNPSCDEIEVKMNQGRYFDYGGNVHITNAYKIIIPKEEPNQETLEHTSKFIVFTIPNCEEWVQHSIPLDSFEKADDFCQQFRDKKMSYLICKTLKQGYNGK